MLEERRRDQEIGRRAVDRRRDVVERRNAQQRLHVHVVGLRRHRVPKEDQSADLPVGDHRTELLVAAQRAGFEQRDVEMRDLLGTAPLRQRPRHHLTRCSGTNQVVPEQNLPIPVDPLRQIAFHVVVGHQCNFLLLFHRHLFSIIASRARKDSPLAGSVVSDRRSGIAAPPPSRPDKTGESGIGASQPETKIIQKTNRQNGRPRILHFDNKKPPASRRTAGTDCERGGLIPPPSRAV